MTKLTAFTAWIPTVTGPFEESRFFGVCRHERAERLYWQPCSGYEPACDEPKQFKRALMLADLCEARLISFDLAGRLADELQFEQRCWVPT